MRLPVRAVTTALLTAFIAACGQVAHAPNPPALYTVTALVMQRPGDYARACAAMPLPEPPIGCGGPSIHGLDLLAMPGVTRYWNGVRATTGFVRLVGTWDGQALTLTRPAEPAAVKDATRMPACAQEPGTSSADQIPPVMRRVIDDGAVLQSHGIQLLVFYPCKGTVFLGLAVADQRSVDFLTSRYGHVEVGGWLQPVS